MRKYLPYLFLLASLALADMGLRAQTSPLSKVDRLPLKKLHPIVESCELDKERGLGKSHKVWIAFSDSDENVTYTDHFGREEKDLLEFMEALFVIRRKNGYCKVISYDPALMEGGIGIGSLIGKRRLTNRDQANYKGWIPEDHLLHSPHALACGHNLRPVKFFAGVSDPKVIANRNEYLDKDSLLLAHAPGFRKAKKGKTLFNDWVYVFKRHSNPPQSLIGTVPSINKDSLEGTFGWVHDSSLVPLAQNMVLLPRGEAFGGICDIDSMPLDFSGHWTEEYQPEGGVDSSRIDFLGQTILEGKDWMLPVNLPVGPKMDSMHFPIQTFVPVEMVDLRNSRIYNCMGKGLSYSRYQALRKGLHTLNLMVVFEDGEEGKAALGNMISSFQEMNQMVRRQGMGNFRVNFAAVGYGGRQITDTLSWTKSSQTWLDFIQERAGDTTIEYRQYEHVMLRGLQEARHMLEGHGDEHNVVMIIGSKIDPVTFSNLYAPLTDDLAKVCATLIFVQSNQGKANNYSDYVLQSKRLLSDVARKMTFHRKQMIVDNSKVLYKSVFRSEDRCGNGAMYDFPSKSMAKGGVFFPNAESWMCPDVLRWVMDSILVQIKGDTDTLLSGIGRAFENMSRLEQEVDSLLMKILDDQGFTGMPDSVTNTYNDPFYVEVNTQMDLKNPSCSSYEPGFLFHETEFAALAKNYRKFVLNPRIDRKGDAQVNYKDRRWWARDLKRRFKERKHLLGLEGNARNASVAEAIFCATGLPVNNSFFHQVTIKEIKKRSGVDQEELVSELDHFYQDLYDFEGWPSKHKGAIVQKGDHSYFLIPVAKLP